MSNPDEQSNIIQPGYWPWQQPLFDQVLSLKQQSRLPHAILIEAKSELVGAPFIWHLTMLLLCENPSNINPCGQCQSLRTNGC